MIFGMGRPAGSRNMRLTQLRMRCGSTREREAANELHELRARLARVIDAADRREDRRNGRDRSGMAS